MRPILIIGICAITAMSVTAVAQNPPPDKTTQAACHDDNRQNKQRKPISASQPTIQQTIELQCPPAEKSKDCECKDTPKTDWWARITNIFIAIGTLGLCVIGGIASCAAIKTLRMLSVQTKANVAAARATKANADALIASERAFLIVELIPEALKYSDGRWRRNHERQLELTEAEIIAGLHYTYQIQVTNIGRTPARLVSTEANTRCGGETARNTDSAEGILAAGQRGGLGFINVRDEIHNYRKQIDSGEKVAVFWGLVKYSPLIKPSELSNADYCYIWKVSEHKLVRQDKHNPDKEPEAKHGQGI